MDYSPKVKKLLGKAGIGDRILVTKEKEEYEGFLMPKSSGNPDNVVIKADSGYNIGIVADKIRLLEKYNRKPVSAKLSFDQAKPPVSMVTTGGTITSKVDYHTGGVISLLSPEELLHRVPELKGIVNIRNIVSPFNKMSEDMDSLDWISIAKTVSKEMNAGAEGVIMTHGTDTLHYTSAALSFMLKNLTKPVVLVAAQRSSDRGSTDAVMNLLCASHAAVGSIAEVGICMHATASDDYCFFIRGTKARKMHASRRDAFRPINELPLAKIWPSGKTEILNENHKKKGKGRVEADAKFEERTALLKAYPGSDPSVMEYYIKKEFRGLVVEAMGMGNVPVNSKKSWIPKIKSAVERGVPVVITSQTLYGRVNSKAYSSLRVLSDAGAIFAHDMLPETAYVKLGWVLGHVKKLEEVRKMMLTNIAGEITEKEIADTFLY